MTGPTLKVSLETQAKKYLGVGEDLQRGMARIAGHLSDSPEHYDKFYPLVLNQKFLPAGRVQSAAGAPRVVTAFNCFVSGEIKDDFDDIMDKAPLRRGKPTVHIKWNESAAILSGDVMFVEAYKMMIRVDDTILREVFSSQVQQAQPD